MRSVRFDGATAAAISFCTIAASFPLDLIIVVTPCGGLCVSYETKRTSIFAVFALCI